MAKRQFPESELIINNDGSCFHLHLRPEQLADRVILVGDPGRVETVASHFDSRECEVCSREFHAITGTYQGKRITVQSTGIGCDNIDIVMNELDTLANVDYNTRTEKDEHRTPHWHLWRIAAIHTHRMLHRLRQKHWLRWSAELLCRT